MICVYIYIYVYVYTYIYIYIYIYMYIIVYIYLYYICLDYGLLRLCFYILPPGAQPIILDQMSGRLAYASIFCRNGIYIYIYINIIHISIYIYIYMYIIHIYIYIYIHIHGDEACQASYSIFTCRNAWLISWFTYACMRVFGCVCVVVFMYACLHGCIHATVWL